MRKYDGRSETSPVDRCHDCRMDAAKLRELQAPLKQLYRDDPLSASTPLHAAASFETEGVTASVQTWAGPVRAGLHPATGGDGSDACSGDMLLQALLACAGVTMRSVATAMGIDIVDAELHATGILRRPWHFGYLPRRADRRAGDQRRRRVADRCR